MKKSVKSFYPKGLLTMGIPEREEVDKIRCKNCGEEWEKDRPGDAYCNDCWSILEKNVRERIRPTPQR